MLSKPPNPVITSKSTLAYTAIRNAIQSGELKPGQRIGPRELAEELGVSYTPVREALTLLEHEGFVSRQPNKGTYVRSMSRTQIEQIYSLRLLLEPMATAEAVLHVEKGFLVKLHGFLRPSEDDAGHAETTFRNQDFHFAIYSAAHNPPLFNLIKQLWIGLPLQAISLQGRSQDSFSEHEAIVAALTEGDPAKAEVAMHTHINNGYQGLLRVLDERN